MQKTHRLGRGKTIPGYYYQRGSRRKNPSDTSPYDGIRSVAAIHKKDTSNKTMTGQQHQKRMSGAANE